MRKPRERDPYAPEGLPIRGHGVRHGAVDLVVREDLTQRSAEALEQWLVMLLMAQHAAWLIMSPRSLGTLAAVLRAVEQERDQYPAVVEVRPRPMNVVSRPGDLLAVICMEYGRRLRETPPRESRR